MKQILLFITLFACCIATNGQSNKPFLIYGQVVESLNKTPLHKYIFVKLLINDSLFIKVPVDQNGNYKIYTDKNVLDQNTCKIFAIQEYNPKDHFIYKDCKDMPIRKIHDEYQPDGTIKLKPPYKDSICETIYMSRVYRCELNLPIIFFNRNSLKYNNVVVGMPASEIFADSAFQIMRCMILENNLQIEISAHADKNEKRTQKLTKRRAEYIKKELIKYGVPDSMIIAKGYGSSRQCYTKAEIKKHTQSNQEKEILRQQNRRAVFSILQTYKRKDE